MSGLDRLMRQEISRISPEVAAFIVAETVDDYGKARAKRNPVPPSRSTFHQRFAQLASGT